MIDLYAIAPELPLVEVAEAVLPDDIWGQACGHIVTLDRQKIGDDEGVLNAVALHEVGHVLRAENNAFSGDGHNPGFFRVVCHLAYRSRLAGCPVNESFLFDEPHPVLCMIRLRDELENTFDFDLRKLDGWPAPTNFINLFESDHAK